MSLVSVDEITVWTDNDGTPVRLFCLGQRWIVCDTPTPLVPDWALMTHAAAAGDGWRFQAATDAGEARMFEVWPTSAGRWMLLRCYE